MKSRNIVFAAAITLACGAGSASAELGWTESQYTQAYGQGQRSYGKAKERGYAVGHGRLVVELSAEGDTSVAELWVLGITRDAVPEKVLQAAAAAEKGREVERVRFTAKSAIPAEIREAIVDDIVVRVDVRNQAVARVALCGKLPPCSWWGRLTGGCEQKTTGCPVLDRALSVDRTMDEMHRRAEDAVERLGH